MALQSYGRDSNQLGTSQFPRTTTEIPEVFYNAIVEDVITNERGGDTKILEYSQDGSNLGQILFRAIPQDVNVDIENLSTAMPMNIGLMEFPLKGDPVIVFRTNAGAYYTNRLNLANLVADSISPTLVALSRPAPTIGGTENRNLAKLQVSSPTVPANKLDTFIKKVTTRHVRASKGDTVVQGRYGNTIRLGSNLFKDPTAENIAPNIILTAGQWKTPRQLSTAQPTAYSSYFENINHDRSSIWMVSDQEVNLVAATAKSTSIKKSHLRSSELRTERYTGAQIFVNSDRVILNSKKSEISLFSNTEINLSAMKSITVDTESNLFITANGKVDIKSEQDIILRGRKILISAAEDLSYKTSGNYTIVGKKIFIGRYGDTSQPVVLGATLSQWLQSFLKLLLTPGAIQTLSGPAIIGPSVLPALLELQRQLGTADTPQRAVFNSRDNFTSETNPV